jgi:hypothetical protein
LATEEAEDKGREIESRQGIGWWLLIEKKLFVISIPPFNKAPSNFSLIDCV